MKKTDALLWQVDVQIGTSPRERYTLPAKDEIDAAARGIAELLADMSDGRIPYVPLGATITTCVTPITPS